MRLFRTLLFFVVLLVAADYVARLYAADRLETTLASAFSLGRPPAVEIEGFPFLWQAVSGELTGVTVATDVIGGREIPLRKVRATLRGVRFSPSDALSGDLRSVRIDGGSGTAELEGISALGGAIGRGGTEVGLSAEDLRAVSVDDRTLSVGPLSVSLPVLADGMTYRSARIKGETVLLRFGFEPTTLRL